MSEEQTYLLRQSRLKAVRDANQAQNGIAKPEPKRKPMTSNERLQGFIECRDNDDGAHLLSFLDGIRFAEKHHSISQRCENS